MPRLRTSYNPFNSERSLSSRSESKLNRAVAFAEYAVWVRKNGQPYCPYVDEFELVWHHLSISHLLQTFDLQVETLLNVTGECLKSFGYITGRNCINKCKMVSEGLGDIHIFNG